MDRLGKRQRRIDEEAGRGEVKIGDIMETLTRQQILEAIAGTLADMDYQMLPVSPVGGVTPDFRARREEDGKTYEVVGVIAMNQDEVGGCYEQLERMEKVLGDSVEYTVAVHQMPEYLLYDVLEADKGRLYIGMKDKMFMMWICYASSEGTRVWCFLGGSNDRMLEARFAVLRQITAEAVVGPRVTDMLLEEEEF